MVGTRAKKTRCTGGPGAGEYRSPLRGAGPVCPSPHRGDGAVPGHSGGGAHCGRRHLEADQTVRRGRRPQRRQPGPKGAGGVFPHGGHRLGTAGGAVLPGPVSGRPVHLRPCPGRDRAGRDRRRHRRFAVRPPGAGGGKVGRQPAGCPPVPDGGRGGKRAALAGAAALYPLSAHQATPPAGCRCCGPCPLWRASC